MKLSQIIIISGLALDIIGAIFLAKGFMAKKIQEIINETATFLGRNKHFQDSLIKQKIEAIIGASFLLLGFLFQVAGNLFPINKKICISTLILFVILAAGSITLFFILLKFTSFFTKKKILKIEAIYHKDKISKYEGRSLKLCGEYLEVERTQNENEEDYKKKIKNKIRHILKKD